MRSSAVVPVHDGRDWLPACLASLTGQGFAEIVVVDDASTDGTAAWLAAEHPTVRVVPSAGGRGPRGFAVAAQSGLDAAKEEAVALVNVDVELAPGWLAAARTALDADPGCGAVACKMMQRDTPEVIDDAGDVLRRDGVCEQRGRGRVDDGRWDHPGEVWGASAGAALYRAAAVREAGGLVPVYRNYLEDVDLALALRSLGWRCAYVPVVARHAGGGSAGGLPAPVRYWVARNTLVLVARWFPIRWWPLVAYRQASWLVAAARDGALRAHVRGLISGLAAGAREWPGRRERRRSVVAVADAIPARPWRGPKAGGHLRAPE